MQTMAQGWLALELSNSAFVVGLVASVGALPVVLFSMHAGAVVDRADRLWIVRWAQAVFLVQAGALWAVTWTGHATVPLLLILAFVQGLCSAIEIPARQSLIVQLVGRDDLQSAIALNSSGFNLARVVGPAISGLVIHRLGLAWCFGLNALSYVAVLWGLARIRLADATATVGAGADGAPDRIAQHPAESAARASLAEALRETTRSALDGLRHLAQPGVVRDLLGMVIVGAVFGGPFLTLMPVVARDRLGLGADGYGWLLAAVGIGGLVGALAVAGPVSHWRRGRVLVGAGLAFPVLLLGFALVRDVALANVLLLGTGAAMIMFNALSNGTLQLLVPEAYRGRLMAFYSLVFIGLSQLVGAFLLGAAARAVGVAWAIAGSALLTLAFAGWTVRRSGLAAL
jgi:MFS family permease